MISDLEIARRARWLISGRPAPTERICAISPSGQPEPPNPLGYIRMHIAVPSRGSSLHGFPRFAEILCPRGKVESLNFMLRFLPH